MVVGDDNLKPTLNEALELFFNGQYEKAIATLEHYANQKDVQALAKLGLAYQLGLGVPIDFDKAIYYLNQAANQGSGESAHNLGTLYANKSGTELKKAREWFVRAKELGFNPSNDE